MIWRKIRSRDPEDTRELYGSSKDGENMNDKGDLVGMECILLYRRREERKSETSLQWNGLFGTDWWMYFVVGDEDS